MTFQSAFIDEINKLAERKTRKKMNPLFAALRGALVGASLGAAASGLASPLTYKGFRMRNIAPRDAFFQTLVRLGERAAYGIPIGMAAGLK